MTQKIMISAGSQCFEFEGVITEIEHDYLILKAKHGDIYIERKFLVFIQYLNEELAPQPVVEKTKPTQIDAAAKFINTRLKHDPVNEILQSKFIPPSQLPDGDEQYDNDEDEVSRNIYGAIHGENPVTNKNNLKDAVKTAMGTETDFAMGMSGGKYKDPAQTILGMKNGNSKKNRNS